MKSLKLFLAAVAVPALFLLLFTLAGCEKELPEKASQSNLDRLPGKYKRTLVLEDGSSKVSLGIASDNAAQLDDFEAAVSLRALTSLAQSDIGDSDDQGLVPDAMEATFVKSEAVHICLLDEVKVAGIAAFQLEVNKNPNFPAGKTEETRILSGFNVFYSWEAPHHFEITPLGFTCAQFYIFQVPNGGSNWFQTSQGKVCHGGSYPWHSINNNFDYRWIANGAGYIVTWY